jgi:hypothetical protein
LLAAAAFPGGLGEAPLTCYLKVMVPPRKAAI